MADNRPRDKPITTLFRFGYPEETPIDAALFRPLKAQENDWLQMSDDVLTATFVALTCLCHELESLPQAPAEKSSFLKRLSKRISRNKNSDPLARYPALVNNQTKWLILVDELLRIPSTHDDIDKRLRKKRALVEECKKQVLELRQQFPDLLFPDSVLSIKQPRRDAEPTSARNNKLGDGHMSASLQDDNNQDAVPQMEGIDGNATTGPEVPPDRPVEDHVLFEDLWQAAFEGLRNRDEDLVVDYEDHINNHALGRNGGALALRSPDSVRTVVNELVDYRQKKQWQFNAFGQKVAGREQVENLLKFVVWSQEIVKAAVSAQPHLALAWTAVSIFFPLIQDQLSKHAVMLDGFNMVSRIQVFWHILDLYTNILEYQARVVRHLSRSLHHRGKENVLDGPDWKQMADGIKTSHEGCQALLPGLQHQEIKEKWEATLREISESRKLLLDICGLLQQQKEQTQRQFEDEKEAKLLQLLPSNYSDGKDFNPKRVDDTCRWFLNDPDFLSWRSKKESSLLWLSASPGCGKSVLARCLIDEQELVTSQLTSTVCYFFFKSGIEERTHDTDALSAMLHQVLTLDMSYKLIEFVLPAYKDCGADLRNNFKRLWETLLDCATSPESGQIICVFDALDECEQKSRGRLLTEIKSFLQLHSSGQLLRSSAVLKFLITSRQIDTIEVPLSMLDVSDRFVHISGEDKTDDVAKDVRLYVEASLGVIAVPLRPGERHDIASLLLGKGAHTYLWLQTIFSEIEQNPAQYGRVVDIKNLIERTPSDLYEVYEKNLNNCAEAEDTRKLLELVLAATRPLTLDEANILLSMSKSAIKYTSHASVARDGWAQDRFSTFVRDTGGLLVVVSDERLHLIHETVRDFLLAGDSKGRWQGQFSLTASHGALRNICVDYLLLDEFQQEMTADQIIDDWYPLYQYAADNWLRHHAQGGSTPKDSLLSIKRLCDEAVPQSKTWMEMYGGANSLNIRGTHFLNVASFLGLGEVIDAILSTEAGSSVNWSDSDGWTPLLCASAVGEYEVVEKLLAKQDIDVNHQNQVGQTAQMLVATFGHGFIMDMLLLTRGIATNAKDCGQQWTALMYAVDAGDSTMVEKLLAAPGGIDVTLTDAHGETALQHALSKGNEAVIGLLSATETIGTGAKEAPDRLRPAPTESRQDGAKRGSSSKDKTKVSKGGPTHKSPSASLALAPWLQKKDKISDLQVAGSSQSACLPRASIAGSRKDTQRKADGVHDEVESIAMELYGAMEKTNRGNLYFVPIDALHRIITPDRVRSVLSSIKTILVDIEDLTRQICGNSVPKP
ncbi:hypothetical protein CDV31_013754, partial [Fusarium ambrosium]